MMCNTKIPINATKKNQIKSNKLNGRKNEKN